MSQVSEAALDAAGGDVALVMASDGLWDELSSQEVLARRSARRVGRAPLNCCRPRSQVASLVGACAESEEGRAAAAAVLVKEALAHAAADNGLSLQQLAALHPLKRRSNHDDITVLVIWLTA